MSYKIKLAEKYSRIANLLDEVGEHEVADACTVIVNRLALDKSFIKEAAGLNLGGLGKMVGGLGKNMLGGGLLGGLMGSLFPGQKGQPQQGQAAQPQMNSQLNQAMQSLSALDQTVQNTLINSFTQAVTKAVQDAQAVAQTAARTPTVSPVINNLARRFPTLNNANLAVAPPSTIQPNPAKP